MSNYTPTKFATALLLSVLLAACGGNDAPAPETPAAEAAGTAVEPTTAEPALDAVEGEPALADAPGGDPAPADPGAPAAAMPADAAGLVAGRDYEEIPGGKPLEPLNGKIEVVEVFNYVCPACAAFQPLVNSWKARLPADVRFTYVPAAFGPRWDPYVRAYYAAEAMGIAERTHDAVFNALHIERTLKGERGEDSPAEIGAFYAKHGVDAKQFASTMASFAVDSKYNRAKQFIVRSQANSTPTMIVNGKYRIKGTSFENMLENTSAMIARVRAQGSAAE
ncbi:thiol:disulfide interchange protein DsbA/DsbL [Luteimonas vadosa]|uniref:Thiol:disulfide interchange protein DsbA n=1 Tax=Luteimonas vadosa TaxID=1165507 RepID=A0ABP9DS28_9GAMM